MCDLMHMVSYMYMCTIWNISNDYKCIYTHMFRYNECEPQWVLDNPALNTAYSPLFIVFSPFDYLPFLTYVTCLPRAASTCVYNGAHSSSDASVLLTSAFHGHRPLGRLLGDIAIVLSPWEVTASVPATDVPDLVLWPPQWQLTVDGSPAPLPQCRAIPRAPKAVRHQSRKPHPAFLTASICPLKGGGGQPLSLPCVPLAVHPLLEIFTQNSSFSCPKDSPVSC